MTEGYSELTLDQWLLQELDLLQEGFAPDWRKRHEEDPEKWPLKMSAASWDRQFLLWHHGCDDL